MGPKTVLIIDDEPAVRKVLERYFARHGCRVVTASNGQEGVDCLKTERPHLIFLDVQMPILDGFGTLRRLQELEIKAPVIMVSGIEDIDAAKKAVALGARDFIRKPFDLEYLDSGMNWRAWMEEDERPKGSKKTFLIVDDDPGVRKVLSLYCAGKGAQVLTAGGGDQALKLVRKEHPDLILLDIQMPEMDGLEVLRRLRDEGIQTPVIMISGEKDEERSKEALRLGARDYLQKPIDLEYLERSASLLAWLSGNPSV